MRKTETQRRMDLLSRRDTLQGLALHDLLVPGAEPIRWLEDYTLRVGLCRLGSAHGGIAIVVSNHVDVWYLDDWLHHVRRFWRGHLRIEVSMRKLADAAWVIQDKVHQASGDSTIG